MMWTYILKLVVLLPLVCGLMIGSLYLWRRLESRMPGKPSARLISVRETMMISPGLKLAVVDFEGRRLLVSVGRGGVTLVDKAAGAAPQVRARRQVIVVTVTRKGNGPALFAPTAAMRRRAMPVARILLVLAALLIAALIAAPAFAQGAPVAAPAPAVGDAVDRALGQLGGGANGGSGSLSLSLQVLIIMGLLSILPGILLMMTSFTRIIIVLSVLRQALGLQQTPPNQVLVGLSLFLSFFIMSPVITQINTTAIQPYSAGRIGGTQMIQAAGAPLHAFMAKQTRIKDVTMFAQMAKSGPYATPNDIPYSVLLPAFVTSELKTAFQIGFLIFLPFIVIDLVVATVLMALGMMMLSPTIISLPFKLLLFVLVDGWALTMGSLANSFAT